MFELPPLFQAIYESGEIPMKELFQVFNCGHRIEFYVDESVASNIIDIAKSFNIESKVIGHVEMSSNGNTNEVIIKCDGQEFVYN
jgi:phosphoribosylformylglycinamidine cyclo-ligase